MQLYKAFNMRPKLYHAYARPLVPAPGNLDESGKRWPEKGFRRGAWSFRGPIEGLLGHVYILMCVHIYIYVWNGSGSRI